MFQNNKATLHAKGGIMGRRRRFLVTFTSGILAGFSFGYILLTSPGLSGEVADSSRRGGLSHKTTDEPVNLANDDDDSIYGVPEVTTFSLNLDLREEGRLIMRQYLGSPMKHFSSAHKDEDRTVANEIARRVRVLCWVMTAPKFHRTRAKHIKFTWGQRCSKLVFISSVEDPRIQSVKVPIEEGWDSLWGKTKVGFQYVYEHYRNEADWFLKVEDDTYVIVENLRYMLSEYSSKDPIYFGCRYKPFTKQGYMSGGAGYVLSLAALELFISKGLSQSHLCSPGNTRFEDVEMGKCLEKVGVKAMDSRDSKGRGRFFPSVPIDHFFPQYHLNQWYWKYIYYRIYPGPLCCSDYAISFHRVTGLQMYLFEYFIYHLRPFGIIYGINDVVPPILLNMPIINASKSSSEQSDPVESLEYNLTSTELRGNTARDAVNNYRLRSNISLNTGRDSVKNYRIINNMTFILTGDSEELLNRTIRNSSNTPLSSKGSAPLFIGR